MTDKTKAQEIQTGKPLTCEEVQQLMLERLTSVDAFDTGLYSLIYYAQQAQGNKIADLVNAAFIAGIRSGEIQTGEQAQPYLDALAKILDLPDEADGALSQIRAALKTLETILDRHFEETLPRLEAAAPEEWEKVERDIDATQDIYNVYIDHIREIYQEEENRRKKQGRI